MTIPPDERVLAVDGGSRRVGLAVGSRATGFASPLAVLDRQSGPEGLAALLGRIARVVVEEGASRIVVGLPLNMDGTEGPAAREARVLGREIERAAGRPVLMVDERLTSEAAMERARRSGWTPKSGRPIDHMAAAVLLESWFADETAREARGAADAARNDRT